MGTTLEEGEGEELDAGGGGSVNRNVEERGGAERSVFTSWLIEAFDINSRVDDCPLH